MANRVCFFGLIGVDTITKNKTRFRSSLYFPLAVVSLLGFLKSVAFLGLAVCGLIITKVVVDGIANHQQSPLLDCLNP